MYVRPRKLRQILGAAFFGALIALGLTAILIIRSPHSHADPADVNAGVTCGIIGSNPTVAGVDNAVINLLKLGYGVSDHGAVNELIYSLTTVCPEYYPLVDLWANSRTQHQTTSQAGQIA